MNADKNEPDGSFPERTKRKKPRRPRPSAAGKRVSPRPAWLTERPAVRVRKDLAAFFEFFTPLHFCVARPAQLVAPARLRKCVRISTGSTLPPFNPSAARSRQRLGPAPARQKKGTASRCCTTARRSSCKVFCGHSKQLKKPDGTTKPNLETQIG